MLPDSPPCKVIVYCRVSTAEQMTEGWSLEAQAARCQQYAAVMNLEIVDTVLEVGSAKTIDGRPLLMGVLKRLLDGEAQGCLVVRLDRLSRSVQDMAHLVSGIFAKCQLLSVTDNIDTRSAAGRMVINMVVTVAQWERETVSERTKDALRKLLEAGKPVGKAPWGKKWERNPVTGECEQVDCAEEIATREVLAHWRRDGWSLSQIAMRANKHGFPKRMIGGRPPKPWTHIDVLRVLKTYDHRAAQANPSLADMRRKEERRKARRMAYAEMRGLDYEELEANYQKRMAEGDAA